MLKANNPRFKTFNKKFESLWEGVAVSHTNGISKFIVVFIARRSVQGAITVLGAATRQTSTIIYIMLVFNNLAYMCFLVGTKPFILKSMMYIEIINEFTN